MNTIKWSGRLCDKIEIEILEVTIDEALTRIELFVYSI